MLTQETKRKIDSARQILVGKVPDPKAQIDQITTALIYKFMDDMDKDAMVLGGKARFFTNGFEKYAWSKILDPRLGGHDRLELYAEAITKLWQNNHLPQLFRDIFKDAFLPYRSPETLSLFLKEINSFTYNHSEDLGDAFEYLLSIMSSQGDAGQFRTPRHIIDFITKVVDPKKDESILDPACGTAGFLISAYKHILKQHDGKDDPDRKEKPLTPDDKKKLMNNLVGYDISPDMVKLSKVNMYLHGFAEPKIYEYDTLSSDEKWDEMYDVIMANPPFMSPKGGIRPHKRFSVQANRAEVLFVDYIKEHLRPNGRAGVIVPEGIIFQSSGAYKQLRKMLVEDGLFAVVSLPQGVFNPYAGVKTSILFFDNALAKRVKHILFIKVNSDGFDLGAQRRAIVTNDLPIATEALTAYRKFLIDGGVPGKTGWPGIAEVDTNPLCQFVSKEEVAKDGNYTLSSERYGTFSIKNEEKWEMIELGDERYFKIESGGTPSSTKTEYWNGEIHWATLVDLPSGNFITNITDTNRKITQDGLKNSSAKLLPKHSVLVSSRATIGRVGINEIELATNQGFKNIVIRDQEKVNYEYVAFMLTQLVKQMESLATGGTFKEISKTNFSKLQIPLPPIQIQNKIVEQISGYQRISNNARAIIDEYKSDIFHQQDWPRIKLGTICQFEGGTQPPKSTFVDKPTGGYIRLLQIRDYKSDKNAIYIPIKERHKTCISTDVMIGRYGPPVFQILKGKEGAYNVALMKCVPDKRKLLDGWLYYFLKSEPVQTKIISLSGRVRQSGVRPDDLRDLNIPLPSLEIQEKLIDEMEKEEKLVASNLELIEIMKRKIHQILNSI